MKKFSVNVTYETGYFDTEISDEEMEMAKNFGIEEDDTEGLVKFHLENNFAEHMDLLTIEDVDIDEWEDEE